MSNAHNFVQMGINFMVRRSTLSDANRTRSSVFFRCVYELVYATHKDFLSDSVPVNGLKGDMYILDSTTISLFSEILKGTGRNPKYKNKKGGIKAHTVLNAKTDTVHDVEFTAASVHDSNKADLLYKLPPYSFAAIDMGYTDYYVWDRLSQLNIYYVIRQKTTSKPKVIKDLGIKGDLSEKTRMPWKFKYGPQCLPG